MEGQDQEQKDHTATDISEGGISLPEKEKKPSVLGKLSAGKAPEKNTAESKAENKKKEDIQI